MVGFGFGQLVELEPLVLVSTEIDLFPQTHHDPLVEDECSKDLTFICCKYGPYYVGVMPYNIGFGFYIFLCWVGFGVGTRLENGC